MRKKIVYFSFLFLVVTCHHVIAQTTFGDDQKSGLSKIPERKLTKHKVLVIPFEPRMYMSQIDHRINAETKWDQKKIKQSIRFGLDEEIYRSVKKKMEVISFLDDTSKYKKDLYKTYSTVQFKFDKIPDQTKYEAPKSEKEKKQVKNGQLMADSDNGGRFMNARFKDNSLLKEFQTQYKTDVFLFINQIDLFSSETPGSLNSHSYRTATIHYTILNADGKELNSGISSVEFPSSVNHPEKIASSYFSRVADEIANRMYNALYPAVK